MKKQKMIKNSGQLQRQDREAHLYRLDCLKLEGKVDYYIEDLKGDGGFFVYKKDSNGFKKIDYVDNMTPAQYRKKLIEESRLKQSYNLKTVEDFDLEYYDESAEVKQNTFDFVRKNKNLSYNPNSKSRKEFEGRSEKQIRKKQQDDLTDILSKYGF